MEDGKKQNEATEKVEETVQEVPFEDQLNRAVEANTDQFYQNVLKEADTKIKAQDQQIKQLTEQQLGFRDEVAVRCYIPLIDRVADHEQAATSAYQAADAFLRARESGFMVVTAEQADEN